MLKNTFSKIKSFVFTNSSKLASLSLVSKMAVFGLVFVLVPFDKQPIHKDTHKTAVKLDINNPVNMVYLPERRVEVYSGGNREDLNSYDPEAIKGMIKLYSEKYGIDWKLVYAIGYHESGNFTSSLARSNNNFFGRKAGSGGYASWSTPEEGIENQVVYLKEHYFDRGLTTPASINRVYAEDMSWSGAVSSVMARL